MSSQDTSQLHNVSLAEKIDSLYTKITDLGIIGLDKVIFFQKFNLVKQALQEAQKANEDVKTAQDLKKANNLAIQKAKAFDRQVRGLKKFVDKIVAYHEKEYYAEHHSSSESSRKPLLEKTPLKKSIWKKFLCCGSASVVD